MGFSCAKTGTILAVDVTANLTGFPVTLVLSDPDLATVGNGGEVTSASGYDIGWFSDEALTVPVPWELEPGSYNAATGALVAHVAMPLSSTTDNVFYMGYGDAAIVTDQSTPTAVWDAAYLRIFHMDDNAASTVIADSTENANGVNAANTSGKTTAGQVGQALTFNGSSDYANIGHVADLEAVAAFTLEAWVYATSTPSGSGIISQNYQGYVGYELGFGMDITDSKAKVGFYNGGWAIAADTASVSTDTWVHIAGTWDGTTLVAYKDGVSVGSSVPGFSPHATADDRFIGRRHDNTGAYLFPGVIDEVRISNVARAPAWIATEHANQSDPAGFTTWTVQRAAPNGGGGGGADPVVGDANHNLKVSFLLAA